MHAKVEDQSLNRQILWLTIPNIISNITVPLHSLIDVGLAGHMAHPEAIGSVTVAATITNTIYWLFGFIRLGTTGLVAQAYGRQDSSDINRQLARGITMALLCTIVVLIISPFATLLSGLVTGGAAERLGVEAEQYIQIIFDAAPAVMLIYALNGWFIGMQNSRVPMIAP
ncbi:MATE family efflux transporter [Porphyromonas uenonis]|uniref:MATE family efflux transporter n=1 Tax=Porphyromonas uenonis TaxID=281920 RepID=UPI000B12AADB|nr:MATE family efflux transporter [Porphyromonas uenonis]